MRPWICWHCRHLSPRRASKTCLERKDAQPQRRSPRFYSTAPQNESEAPDDAHSQQPDPDISNTANSSDHSTQRTPNVFWRKEISSQNHADSWGLHNEKRRARYDSRDITRPPFLVEREKKRTSRLDRFRWLEHAGQPGVKRNGMRRSERENLALAPFATHMLRNPYARTLASPIRECAFTNARLPRDLMLDFHLVEWGELLADLRTDAELQLLPLSLAAGMIATKQSDFNLTPQEREVRQRWDEERTNYQPGERASYVNARKDIVDSIAKATRSKVPHLALTVRARERQFLGNSNPDLGMRKDMAEVVENGLKRLLWKRLGFFVRDKAGKPPDIPGILQALPWGSGVRRVHELENVGCVLRLKPVEHRQPVKEPGEPSPLQLRGALRKSERFPKDTLAQDPPADAMTRTLEYDEGGSLIAQPFELIPEADNDPTVDGEAEPIMREGADKAAAEEETLGSTTQQMAEGEWSERRMPKFAPHMVGIRPLPPPARPSELYFATIRWRNSRVPIYSLPQLFGDEMCAKLLADSVFKDTEYIAVKHHRGATVVHQLLMKLQAYVATTKDQAVKI